LPRLFNVAEAIVASADLAFDGWSPLIEIINRRSNPLPDSSAFITERLSEPLSSHRAQFAQAKVYLDDAITQRAHSKNERLSPRVQALVAGVDRLLALMSLAVEGGMVLPELLGAQGTRSYLLIAQNEDELRPTGGFISAAGMLTLEHGKLSSLEFMD